MGLKAQLDEMEAAWKESGRLHERLDILESLREDIEVLINQKDKYPSGTLARAEIDAKISVLHHVFKKIRARSL